MKSIKTNILIGLLVLSGCGSDYLTVEPNNLVTTDNYYQTEADGVSAVNAIYTPLQALYNGAAWHIGDIMSDDTDLGGGGGGDGSETLELDNFTLTSQNPIIKQYFQQCYIGIERANIALDKIPGIAEMSTTVKNRSLGEAQFLRAFYYFQLVRLFGDVPLYTKPISLEESRSISRSAASAVYNQIISDLQSAETLLPPTNTGDNVGRATAGAAKGLLASVYLTLNRKSEAAAKALEVINNEATYGYGLNADYSYNFSLDHENNQETVFAVQYRSGGGQWSDNGPGQKLNTFMGPRGQNVVQSSGYGWNVPTLNFYNQYERSGGNIIDSRRPSSMWVPGDNYTDASLNYTQPSSLIGSPNGFNVKKYFVPISNLTGDNSGWTCALNVNVMRYSEILLIYAEAAGIAAGKAHIDRVRQRAGLDPLDAGLNDADYLAAVYKERRIEFAFEMHRWYDLLRHPDSNYFLTVMQATGKNIQAKHRYMPIPQSERDVNHNLTQNAGY